MNDGSAHLIDELRSACLCEEGQNEYLAALLVAADGDEHLALVQRVAIGDERVRADFTCSTVEHEQLGELPLEFVRRIAVSRRTNRCGRPTKTGAPCQTPVADPGAACAWHRNEVSPERNHR
jgi:hypothetical protein